MIPDDLARAFLTAHALLVLGIRLLFLRRMARRPSTAGADDARPDRLVPLGSVLALLGLIAWLALPSGTVPGAWMRLPQIFGLGTALLVGHVVLLVASQRALDASWSGDMRLRPDHALITHGIYARSRHPMYLGVLFWCAGTIAVGSHALLLAYLPLALGVIRRAPIEETLLEARHGDAWSAYATKTNRWWRTR